MGTPHFIPRNRRRKLIAVGGASLADVQSSTNGWLVDWNQQETSGVVAVARNRAMTAPETRDVLEPDTDFTVAPWVLAGTGSVDDLDSFTITGASGGMRGQTVQVFAPKTYSARIKGTTTASNVTIRDGVATTTIYDQSGATGAFDLIFTFTAATNGFYIRNESAGTTDIDWANSYIQQTNILASSAGLGLLDGDHTGVTVGVPGNGRGIRYAARDDGGTTFTDILSAELNSMLSLNKGSANIWFRVSGAAVWTDGVNRVLLDIRTTAGAGLIIMRKGSANNTIETFHKAGGTQFGISTTTTSLEFNMLTMTWDNDVAVDEYKMYLNAVQQGTTQTGLGTQSDNIVTAVMGARTTVPNDVWNRDRTYTSLYDEVLTQSKITEQWNAGN